MLWFAYFVGAPKVLSLKFPALKEQFISIMENSSFVKVLEFPLYF